MLIVFLLFFLALLGYALHCFFAIEVVPNKESINKNIATICSTLSKEELEKFQSFTPNLNVDSWYFNAEELAEKMAYEMCSHYGISVDKIDLYISENLSCAGMIYMGNSDEYIIEIDVRNIEIKERIFAILAHEITHIFLKKKGLELEDTRANEILTDTCAAFLGFADIMLRHYVEETKLVDIKEQDGEQIPYYATHKIGYLDIDELSYIIALRNFYFKTDATLKAMLKESSAAFWDSPQLVIRGYWEFEKQIKRAPFTTATMFKRLQYNRHKKQILNNPSVSQESKEYSISNKGIPHVHFLCPICSSELTTPLFHNENSVSCARCKASLSCLTNRDKAHAMSHYKSSHK